MRNWLEVEKIMKLAQRRPNASHAVFIACIVLVVLVVVMLIVPNHSDRSSINSVQVLSVTSDWNENLVNCRVVTADAFWGLTKIPCTIRLIPSTNPHGGVDMFLEVTLKRVLTEEMSLHYAGTSLGQDYQVYVNGAPRLYYFAGSRIVERPGFLK